MVTFIRPHFYKRTQKCLCKLYEVGGNPIFKHFSKQTSFSVSVILLQENAEVLKTNKKISGGPLSALTCCVNVRLLSAIKKISPLIYSQSWVGSWVYTTQAMMTFTLIF